MKTFNKLLLLFVCSFSLLLTNCDEDGDVNVFSIQDDLELGRQLAEEIASKPDEYPLLDTVEYAEAYGHLERMVSAILASDDINYREEFDWKFHIVDDSILNAFAAPGGYIYVYTGLIKFLDDESELAGVLGHEIGHADKRHVTDQLTKTNTIDALLKIVLGQDESLLGQIATGLIGLKFSRNHESESDEFSVEYLYDTEYDPRGAAGFFQKLLDMGSAGGTPEFLSTHPSPDNRVEAIKEKWEELGAVPGETFPERYQDFKNSLP